MDEIQIFTDGACEGNPGPGGYAAIIDINGERTEVTGSERQTTNNRMELLAVIAALRTLPSRRRFACSPTRSTWRRA